MSLNSLEVKKCCKNYFILFCFVCLQNFIFLMFFICRIIFGQTCYGNTVLKCKHMTLAISVLNDIFPLHTQMQNYHLKYSQVLHKMS